MKLCKTDIRFMWLLDGENAPCHMTVDNFMNEALNTSIESIFAEINGYIFAEENVDPDHIHIDGTKLVANANKYSWVWKKSSVKNRQKTFRKVTDLLEEINTLIVFQGVKFGLREEYAIEYLEEITEKYISLTGIKPDEIPTGKGHRKTPEQRLYVKLVEYTETLKKYAEHIRICGEEHGMEKYMKFTMFKKETEELYQCEDCSECPLKKNCCKCEGNRVVSLNEELSVFHKEVIGNLNSVHGALLRMNRSIQAEGAYGGIKWNRAYTRARRRGLDGLMLEISVICCGFDLHKYHLKKSAKANAA